MRWLNIVRNVVIAVAGIVPEHGAAADPYADQRRRLVDEVVEMVRSTARETGRATLDPRTVEALGRVPRHRFVPPGEEASAYRNRPLAIGGGQTISQPYIVALMTDLLDVGPRDRVLEIGLGSGYQAAMLAELVAQVYSVEIIPSLARDAAQRLAELGYRNVATRVSDGHLGWPEHAPYDAIIVTAAAAEVPKALLSQLRSGGRMVIPLGPARGAQTLYVLRKREDGSVDKTAVLGVRFVPFTGSSDAPSRR